MMFWCFLLASALGAIVVLYGLLEVHYFLRMCLCGILARFIKKRSHILDTTTVTGICLTTDLDTLLYHMNNARYLRELDFARVDFYERTQLYKTILSKGGSVVQGATTIRYRRFIRPFSMFRITSRIIYWDNQTVFMEHRFISLKDSFVHCIAICRQRFLNCSAEDVLSTLIAAKCDDKSTTSNHLTSVTTTNNTNSGASPEAAASTAGTVDDEITLKLKPEMPLDISKWIEYNEISSKNLRNGC